MTRTRRATSALLLPCAELLHWRHEQGHAIDGAVLYSAKLTITSTSNESYQILTTWMADPCNTCVQY